MDARRFSEIIQTFAKVTNGPTTLKIPIVRNPSFQPQREEFLLQRLVAIGQVSVDYCSGFVDDHGPPFIRTQFHYDVLQSSNDVVCKKLSELLNQVESMRRCVACNRYRLDTMPCTSLCLACVFQAHSSARAQCGFCRGEQLSQVFRMDCGHWTHRNCPQNRDCVACKDNFDMDQKACEGSPIASAESLSEMISFALGLGCDSGTQVCSLVRWPRRQQGQETLTLRILSNKVILEYKNPRSQSFSNLKAKFTTAFPLPQVQLFLAEISKLVACARCQEQEEHLLPDESCLRCAIAESTQAALCGICTNQESVEEVRLLDCGHWFHNGCFELWLVHDHRCPICKASVGGRDEFWEWLQTDPAHNLSPAYEEHPPMLATFSASDFHNIVTARACVLFQQKSHAFVYNFEAAENRTTWFLFSSRLEVTQFAVLPTGEFAFVRENRGSVSVVVGAKKARSIPKSATKRIIANNATILVCDTTNAVKCRDLFTWEVLWEQKLPFEKLFGLYELPQLDSVVAVSSRGEIWTSNGEVKLSKTRRVLEAVHVCDGRSLLVEWSAPADGKKLIECLH